MSQQQAATGDKRARGGSAERVIPLLRSCERCRRRKQRCDGEQPVCGRCKSHQTECSYRESGRFRKRFPRGPGNSRSRDTDDDREVAELSAATTLSSLVNAGVPPMCVTEQAPLPVISAPRLASISEVPESPDASVASTAAASGYLSAPIASGYHSVDSVPGYNSAGYNSAGYNPTGYNSTTGYLHPHDARSSMLFPVPELSPNIDTDLSPNHAIINTPIGVQPLLSPSSSSYGNRPMINPVHELKTRDLPDLSRGLPESILHQMWALIGGLDNADSDLGTLNSESSVLHNNRRGELPPNMDLLDPRNTAANEKPYTMENMAWLQGDPLKNLQDVAEFSDGDSVGLEDGSSSVNQAGLANTLHIGSSVSQTNPAAISHIGLAIPQPNPAGPQISSFASQTNPAGFQISSFASQSNAGVPSALCDLAQRYGLHEQPSTLLAMLKASFVDSEMKIRTRQFWVTLESGNISDFVILAHLTIAAREAQLSSKITLLHPQASIEGVCYEAARREWDMGRVEATTGAVYALLLLSEYGFQIGRNSVLWEFAHNALATARRIEFRHTRYPWRGARTAPCDVEYEHVLACYWSGWARVLTAAQTMTRRVDSSLYARESELPEFPLHDMCHYTAQPVACAGNASTPNVVSFSRDAACRFRAHHSYSAATWRCSLMAVEMHNHYIDLIERRSAPESYIDALRVWDERMRAWRASWPREWQAQTDEMLAVARRVNDEKYGGRVPLENNTHVSAPVASAAVDPSVYHSERAQSPDTISVGSHLFHTSQMTAADTWLSVLLAMYETSRLRAHRIALALLQRNQASSGHASPTLLLPRVAVGHQYDEQLRKLPVSAGAADPLRDSLEFHRSQYVCLDAARNLQSLFTTTELLGSSPQRMGIWAVFVLEHVIAIHCARLHTSDTATQMDALRRLALLVRQLLSLRRWTSALFVFTSIVKAFVEPSCIIELPERQKITVRDSPWPANHVLTLLMHEMKMDARQFCAFTVPIVYASMMSSEKLAPAMRIRIAALLS